LINAVFATAKTPFMSDNPALLKQQQDIVDTIKIHATQGGFSVIIGEPGVGKSMLKSHIESWHNERNTTVVSVSRTMHTYLKILLQLGQSAKLDVPDKTLEKALIEHMFAQARQHKTLYTLIDEAHLLPTDALRRLRLLVDKFPKKHNLVLFGQSDLMHYLSLAANADIKSRITYSNHLQPLTDVHLTEFIERELTTANMGANTFTEGALELILRNANGNLRLCKNLCYGSLMEAARKAQKEVTINHVNAILIQPHWRTYKELITQQVPK
jgi:MSHA biogenesis protein MshM